MAVHENENVPQQTIPNARGHAGQVIQTGVEKSEAKFTGADSIGSNSRSKNSKSAGTIGATNQSHV